MSSDQSALDDVAWSIGQGDLMDEFADAIAYIREHYEDSYAERLVLSKDLLDVGRDCDEYETAQVAVEEGILQDVQRYQDVPPEDIAERIERVVVTEDGVTKRGVLALYATFATEHGSRYDKTASTTGDS